MINKKKLKHGSVSIVFTALFIAVLVVLNLFATFVTDRFSLTFDMTGNNLFDLSGETIQTISKLNDVVNIVILDNEEFGYTRSRFAGAGEKYFVMFPELINRYKSSSGGMINVTYIDPVRNPTALEKYKDLELSATDVLVEGPKRKTVIDAYSFFEVATNTTSAGTYQYVSGLKFEQKLTSALTFVTSDVIPKALFVKGHEEMDLAGLKNLLADANYEDAGNINLMTTDIPDDVDNLFVIGPQNDFSPEEVAKLDDFMARGGNLYVFLHPGLPKFDVLERYIAEWGVSYKRDLALDSELSILTPYEFLCTVPSSDITKPVFGKDMPFRTVYSAPIEILWETDEWRTTYPILLSPDTSYSRPIAEITSDTDYAEQPGDASGPFNMAVLTKHYNPNNDLTSHLLIGSIGSIVDSFLTSPTYLNSNYYGAVLSYITPNNDTVIVTPKVYSSPTMLIEKWQSDIIAWIIMAIIPISFLVLGCAVWLRRRNK